MTNHRCISCDRVFSAVSREEAEEAYEKYFQEGKIEASSFQLAVDANELAYARFCPYCGCPTVSSSC